MSGNYRIYRDGIKNQFPTYSVSHETVGSRTIATAKLTTGGAFVNNSGPVGDVYTAYRILWERLNDGQTGLIPSLTTTEIGELTGVDDGVQVIDKTLRRVATCVGGAFQNPAGAGTMKPVAFGEMVEDSASGSKINTSSKLWDTASAGDLDPNGLITFLNTPNGDELKVGVGGAGTYQVHFSCTFTNAGGKLTKAGIHKNGTQVGKMEDVHQGDSSEKRDLRGAGFLALADNDLITLHVESETASDEITVYHCHITMQRMT